MKKRKNLFRVISLFFKTLDKVCINIISTVLTAIITVAVLGCLVILGAFVFKTVSTLLAGNL